jgi:hypothetical protein
MQRLPADSPYRKVNHRSYFAAVATLWRGAGGIRDGESAIALWRSRRARA